MIKKKTLDAFMKKNGAVLEWVDYPMNYVDHGCDCYHRPEPYHDKYGSGFVVRRGDCAVKEYYIIKGDF